MKALTAFLSVVNLAAVCSLGPVPFKVREITHRSIYVGPQQRIYGGSEAKEGQFPFMVFAMILVREGISQCSASLVRPDWVLMAAHCVNFPDLAPKDIILVGGRADVKDYVTERLKIDQYAPVNETKFWLQERRAVGIYIHPGYSNATLMHDIAVVQLDKPFRLGKVQTIPISTDEITSPKSCTILGWGLTRGNVQPYTLNFVTDRRVTTAKLGCHRKEFGPFICLQPDDSGICQGDSGSPLVCDGKVWGVASHFISAVEKPDCGDSIEEYYSEIYPDVEWLRPLISEGYRPAADIHFLTVFAAVAAFYSKL